MTQDTLINFMNSHGLIIVFIAVFSEYLNLAILPSGVIFPTVGFWVKTSGNSWLIAFAVCLLAGLLGSMILYSIGRYGSDTFILKLYTKFPKMREKLLPYEEKMQKNAEITVLIARVIPVIRTLIGFPAGAIKMDLSRYLICSAVGISLYNSVLILFGATLSSLVS